MLGTLSGGGVSLNGANGSISASSHTITALKRWSCDDRELPSIQQIKAIHVYDFDNTLFASPLPNKQIWSGLTVGQLQSPDIFVNGGWWHDASILASTGEGVEKEEPRAWEGWWNEQIVKLVELTMEQKDALNVLLTGRSESQFADLVKRMVRSKNLHFDMICLKPAVGPANQKFNSTMAFKQELLKDIVYTYREAEEIRVYEDRPKHTRGFRDFFEAFNKALLSPNPPISRSTITAEVIQVAEEATTLEPVSEVAEVQRLINIHNMAVKSGLALNGIKPLQIKRTVFYTGYLVQPPDVERLKTLVKLPPGVSDDRIRYLANNILITPRPCPKSLLDRVGGIGKKLTWKVTGTAFFENKIWAARAEPVPATAKYHTDNPTPTVVLALRQNAKPVDASRIQNWQPVPEDKAFEFETVVGERVTLRVEEEQFHGGEWENFYPNRNSKRLHPREEDFIFLDGAADGSAPRNRQPQHSWPQNRSREEARRPVGSISANQGYRGGNQNRGRGGQRGAAHGGRGGRGAASGRGGNSRGRPRGNHGPHGYKSLDDVGDHGYHANAYANYDDGGYQSGGQGQRDGSLYNAY